MGIAGPHDFRGPSTRNDSRLPPRVDTLGYRRPPHPGLTAPRVLSPGGTAVHSPGRKPWPAPFREIESVYSPTLRDAGLELVFPHKNAQMTEAELLDQLPGCVASLAGS